MGRKIGWLGISSLGLVLGVVGAFAQGVGSSGRIRGTVTDASGAVLPSVSVAIVDPDTGFQRSATTDSSGQFQTTGLPPATYNVTAQHAGFATEIRKGLAVGVGQTIYVDFQLQVSQVSVQVEVTDEPPVVETERGSQANSVPERYIMDLPIDRRDYLTFTLLMPGVSNSSTIVDNADFRVKQTPQSGLSFYGSNGRGNSVTVDGGEANDESGGVRLNVSQDAAQEFQINRSNYTADQGGASGASINIVTKSGTNSLHGGLYGFFRNDAMDARDPFAFSPALSPGGSFSLDAQGQPIKNSLNRQQFGGTLGFPIQKDRTFGFVAYEGLRADAQDSVPLLTHSSIFAPTASQVPILAGLAAKGNALVPCISSQTGPPVFLPAAICAFGLQSILTVNPTAVGNPFVSPEKLASDAFIVNQFAKDGGLFPFPIREHQVSARVDHRFSERDQAFLRYSFVHLQESDPDVQALIGFSRGTSILNWDSTLQGSWFHQFSPSSTNELRIQWNWYQFNVTTNDLGGPGLDVQGYGFFGRQIFLPNLSTIRRYEFADNFSLLRGHHNMRMGFYELIRGNNTTSQTFFPGRFEFLQLPGGLVSPCLQDPVNFCGIPPTSLPPCLVTKPGLPPPPSGPCGAPLSTLQSWSLGLPAFYEQGFGDPRYVITRPFTAAYWQDSWQMRPGFTWNYGLRYELDSQYGPLSTYKKNFSPRLSFAWDPFRDHKTVIRGGYGIFYSPIYAQIPNVVKTLGDVNGTRQIANTLVTIRGLPTNPLASSAAVYQTLFPQGKILCGTPPPGENACITAADLAQFGIQVSNTGPLPPGTVIFSGQPDYRNPQSQQASFGIERQIGNGLSISANYIYVHTTHLPWAVDKNLLPTAPIVTGTGADGLPTNGLPFQDWGAPPCVDAHGFPTSACFANPALLQNNQYSSLANAVYHGGILELKKRFSDNFTLMGNYTYSKAIDDSTDFNSDYSAFNEVNLAAERSLSDFDQRHKVVVASVIESPWTQSKILSGFQLSPVVSYNSGHPFNLLAGSDINGDGHFTNDRPPGAPRNSGLGPDYVSFDLRLSKNFRVGEKASLRFTAEAFNLTNRTNYAAVNNVVGATFAPPFDPQGTASRSPSQPLGFTSAFPKREIQLGARLTF
jgi:hypothetical protein